MSAIKSTNMTGSAASAFASKLTALTGLLRKVLLFSPSDDRVYPRNNLSAAIEKGRVSVSFGSKFLSRISIRGTKEYLFDDARYPLPEDVASSAAAAIRDLGASGADVALVLPGSWVIVKKVEFPSTVRENLSDVVRYEMDRITPISPDEAYYDFRIIGEDSGRISLLVAVSRADTVSPYISSLGQKGIRVGRLCVPLPKEYDRGPGVSSLAKQDAPPSVAGVYSSLGSENNGLNLLRKGARVQEKTPYLVTLLLLITLSAMGIFYMAAPLRVETKRLRDISAQVSAKKEEARKVELLQKDVEAMASEIATINNFKPTQPVALNILKEITTQLPNTSWLTRFRITETTVDLEGYAKSANELLPKLEASKYLRKVEMSSPTFRDPKTNMDRFVIKMEIEGAKKIEPITPQKAEAPKNEKK
ncbi:MAG: PilN domain-containing protein [Nitrospirae bacterium]|nr:PilN domain-containing protein [Nitrospirota bacterium]